jgi:hypothetical protein
MIHKHWRDSGLQYKGLPVWYDNTIAVDEIHAYGFNNVTGKYDLLEVQRFRPSLWQRIKWKLKELYKYAGGR